MDGGTIGDMGIEPAVDFEEDPLEESGLSSINAYRKEEQYLAAESARLEDRAARLRSKAKKLLQTAQTLKNGQSGGRKQLPEDR